MLHLHDTWVAVMDWLHKAFPICPIIFGMVNGHRRRTDRGPLEQILIALVVQIITAAAAVAIGVYVAVQILEVRIGYIGDSVTSINNQMKADEKKADDRWDRYLQDRANDARRREGESK